MIVLGFLLNLSNYTIELFDAYDGDSSSIVFNMDDTEEKSESNENEKSEKEDLKEKEKISQFYQDFNDRAITMLERRYPDFYIHNSSVYLEYSTPPPEHS
ncbi:hypothetical protein [Aquimarina sp. 2201CG14-23]|uniref:hypothetical protein n=1 Tax=Aquimarina mycalae TaxID=3040073 RepID=UPI0024781F51|nr:hypothetical protein [Aquimarina sp. 2201CG14-23]MDH7447325.1 hypothetical protein [Aquimarina sp. 2201CG14-23]